MTDAYKPLVRALMRQDKNRSLRLPRDPKRALADIQAFQLDTIKNVKERGWG